jgi:hypothetical protein
MATVGAVYDLTPSPRTAEDVFPGGGHVPLPAPVGKGKWLVASVVEEAAAVVRRVFEEAERRDTGHERAWVALVDGNNHQIRRIKAEAKARGISVPIVVDLVQVREYFWKAAWCFFAEGDAAAEVWVREKATAVLEGRSSIVAAAIRRKATCLRLDKAKRAIADICADYLLRKGPYLDYPNALEKGVAHRHRRHRRCLPAPREGPHGPHRCPLEACPARRRSSCSARCAPTVIGPAAGRSTGPRNDNVGTPPATQTGSCRSRHDLTPGVPHPKGSAAHDTQGHPHGVHVQVSGRTTTRVVTTARGRRRS